MTMRKPVRSTGGADARLAPSPVAAARWRAIAAEQSSAS